MIEQVQQLTPQPNKILSERELANVLGLSPWTVRGFRLKNNLPHIRTAGRIFYRLDSVERWFDEQEAGLSSVPEMAGIIRQIH